MSTSTKNFILKQHKYDRVVLLVDMDCFYCQVEEKLDPTLKGQPLAVVQYNAWRGGGIIAVNYAARAKGVTRHMRGDEAKEQCPEIQLAKVPNVREKADLTKYREAGKEVANVLQKFTHLLERASVDEAYLDITELVNERVKKLNAGTFILQPEVLINTFAVGYDNIGEYINLITQRISNRFEDIDDDFHCYDSADLPAIRQSDIRLLVGASIASEIRAAVKETTEYDCSAGIAHNKILAKLACGMNKPNKQTILPLSEIPKLFETLPVHKIKGLGAKFGEDVCQRMNVRFLGELVKFSETELQKKIGEKNGSWLYNICRGIDLETVTPRFYSKSIGCCKKFPGRNNISGLNTLKHWLNELAGEIVERLEKDIVENNRRAKQMVVSFIQDFDGEEIHGSRSAPLSNYDQNDLAQQSLDTIKANTKQFMRPGSDSVLKNPIKFLGISVGKFETISKDQSKLQQLFANHAVREKKNNPENVDTEKKLMSSTVEAAEVDNTVPQPRQANGKMSSFFFDYLHNKKTESDNCDSSKAEDECIPTAPAAESKPATISKTNEKVQKPSGSVKSFFLKALKTQNDVATSEASESIVVQELAKDPENENRPPSSSETNAKEEILNVCAAFDDIKEILADVGTVNSNAAGNSSLAIPSLSNVVENATRKRKLSEVSEPRIDPSATNPTESDYQARYVEYGVPELQPELLQFTTCDICKEKIPTDVRLLQEHQDLHFAQQLSQQQRVEFRAEIKTKIGTTKNSTSSSTSKKAKKCTSPLGSTLDITKFLKPPTQPEPPLTLQASTSKQAQETDAATETQLCSKCNVHVRKSELTEHMDFHYARELQSQMNELAGRPKSTVGKKTKGSGSCVAMKSIAQFFSQQH